VSTNDRLTSQERVIALLSLVYAIEEGYAYRLDEATIRASEITYTRDNLFGIRIRAIGQHHKYPFEVEALVEINTMDDMGAWVVAWIVTHRSDGRVSITRPNSRHEFRFTSREIAEEKERGLVVLT
jgi:hypothetical protein